MKKINEPSGVRHVSLRQGFEAETLRDLSIENFGINVALMIAVKINHAIVVTIVAITGRLKTVVIVIEKRISCVTNNMRTKKVIIKDAEGRRGVLKAVRKIVIKMT